MDGQTQYSEKIKGAKGNYEQPVRYDFTDGFVGITQYADAGKGIERVLLSPKQMKELIAFAQAAR